MKKMGETREPSQDPKKPGRYNSYLRYSALAVQLIVSIGVMGWIGYRLDRYLDLRFPAFTLLLVMVTFTYLIWKLYRSLNRD